MSATATLPQAGAEELCSTENTRRETTPRRLTEGLTRAHRLSFGTELQADGRVLFRLWGPAAEAVCVAIEGQPEPLPMERRADGSHELLTGQATAGSLYQFVLPDGLRVPDPASRFQPRDVHGPSEVIDPARYTWHDTAWHGRAWDEAVLYELHVGAFSEEGTFQGAIGKLDHLVELGVTTIEIMPVADFPGKRGWGYDGVLLYAPDASYGRPEDLKALVEAAHARGLSVMLDVVYNHYGPDGNYMGSYFPDLFTKRHKTSWDDAVNFDAEGSQFVREFVIGNALYWIEEFHLDGLRLDAVHAIIDGGPVHLLDELAARARALVSDRPLHLVLENEDNQARRIGRDTRGKSQRYTAQWNDDMHHVLHTAATNESAGYYADYTGNTELLGKALAEGFAFQGEVMPCRASERGEPSKDLPPDAFIAFIQNHDQIGNRAFGERLNHLAPPEAVRALVAVYLLLPQIPMLFMGEEWCAPEPFPYFCDFEGQLADDIRKGRRDEFAKFPAFHDPAQRDRIPDPLAESTFQSAKLNWELLKDEKHRDWFAWYKQLITLRQEEIVPLVRALQPGTSSWEVVGEGAVAVQWKLEDGRCLHLFANLSAVPQRGYPHVEGVPIWREGPYSEPGELGPWSVLWSVER